MPLALANINAARKALAAAHRVDEAKDIRDKAEAVRAYAQQAGNFELQNTAAEIRLLAEYRVGSLLLEMAKNPGTRGAGRPGKDGTRRSSRTTTYPPKLTDLGISKDQSAAWQKLARSLTPANFEEALTRAKADKELTTTGLLRVVKEMTRPKSPIVEPDINVIAAEVVKALESHSLRDKLRLVVGGRERLNFPIRRNLIHALKTCSEGAKWNAHRLAADFQDVTDTTKAHQRQIRDQMAKQPDPALAEKKRLATDFKNATVREISYAEAKNVILGNEWLGTMGSVAFSFGLFFGKYLAGAVCFGSTAGSNVAASIAGVEHSDKVMTLCRGANSHWAHEHAGSFLVAAACNLMASKGFPLIVAYSDPGAGEIGTIYSSCNFYYCGITSATEQFRTPDGKVHDSRQVSGLARDRTGGTLKMKRSRAEQKQILLNEGCEFFGGTPKFRYVGIFGDRRTKRILRQALRFEPQPYPKRSQPPTELVA